ncbi:MAG TPA: hypothetical protein VHY84_04165 [Bryobacteraceae bacterium]|nr:hypothetical protein [Bryobacteraceae bacterium]
MTDHGWVYAFGSFTVIPISMSPKSPPWLFSARLFAIRSGAPQATGPEPPADAKAQAVARARERHDRLLKTVGRSMLGDSAAAMQDLVSHGQE